MGPSAPQSVRVLAFVAFALAAWWARRQFLAWDRRRIGPEKWAAEQETFLNICTLTGLLFHCVLLPLAWLGAMFWLFVIMPGG